MEVCDAAKISPNTALDLGAAGIRGSNDQGRAGPALAVMGNDDSAPQVILAEMLEERTRAWR